MEPLSETVPEARRSSPFAAHDVQTILERQGWLSPHNSDGIAASADDDAVAAERAAWLAEAAQLLGVQATDHAALERLLEEIFRYDARENLARVENQAVMAREAARLVLRELARLVLDSPDVNSDRYKEIVTALKERTGRRGQELFHPVRLALAGRFGGGEHDRVILLLDRAARLPWAVAVKSCRERILEFCGTID
jgi:hypothetical protein